MITTILVKAVNYFASQYVNIGSNRDFVAILMPCLSYHTDMSSF